MTQLVQYQYASLLQFSSHARTDMTQYWPIPVRSPPDNIYTRPDNFIVMTSEEYSMEVAMEYFRDTINIKMIEESKEGKEGRTPKDFESDFSRNFRRRFIDPS